MVAFPREGLEVLSEVAVVPIGTDRNTSADGCIEIPGILFPLLESVVFEKLFVELPADLGDDDLLGVGRVLYGDALGGKPRLELLAGTFPAEVLLEGVEVDREFPIAPIGVAENPVLDRMPLGELREILNDAGSIGAEIVGAVFVD